MNIHKLHIFAKNRDAVAAQKGYAYQQFKTLEDWLEARISRRDEAIYCDYEDDIFERNIGEQKAKFKQIKLYATDFSFSSESIKTAIVHFFMLYVKGEYAFDQIEFVFETNSSIVQRTVKENDADLLQAWHQIQHDLKPDLLDKIRVRVKKILGEYVEEMFRELRGKADLKDDLEQAKKVYDGLKDEDFDAFIRCIKWQFEGIESNLAIAQIQERIESLIPKIPLPLSDEKAKVYVALLVKEVYQRSIQDDSEARKLTNDLLDSILLNAGEQEDQWYAETFQQFKEAGEINAFFAGEFQAVISGARYCRWNMNDEGHKSFWLHLLKQYISLENTPVAYKRKAIYEYLFLKIGHNFFEERTESAIKDDLEFVTFYINHWAERNRLRDIEDDITILQLIKGQVMRFGLPVEMDKMLAWEEELENFLDERAAKEKNVDWLCEIIELQGHLANQQDVTNPISSFQAALGFYRRIPPLLKDAQYYSLAVFYRQLNAKRKLLIEIGGQDELIRAVDDFMDEIQEYAEKTGLRHKAAHDLIDRARLYLKKRDVAGYLSGLELFHRAKELWRLEYTNEGYILVVLNIAQLYHCLGMSYASKYYGLAALWSIWHFSDPALYKRLPQALAIITHNDFRHGAWLNAIDDFMQYLLTKREFDEKGFWVENDTVYQKTMVDIAQVIYAAPLLHPGLSDFLEEVKKNLGLVWVEHIAPLVVHLAKEVKDEADLKRVLARLVKDRPLNDVGPDRRIRFTALGIRWRIRFSNNQQMTAIGEEFVSGLQIALCELARVKKDILLSGRDVNILVQEGHFQKEHAGDDWVVTIPLLDTKDPSKIAMHNAYLGSLIKSVLSSLSHFTKEQFNAFYKQELLEKARLGNGKAMEATAYQKAYKYFMTLNVLNDKGRAEQATLPDDAVDVYYPNYLLATNNSGNMFEHRKL